MTDHPLTWVAAPVRLTFEADRDGAYGPWGLRCIANMGGVMLAQESTNARAGWRTLTPEREAWLRRASLRKVHKRWKVHTHRVRQAIHFIVMTLLREYSPATPKTRPAGTWSGDMLSAAFWRSHKFPRYEVSIHSLLPQLVAEGLLVKHTNANDYRVVYYTVNVNYPGVLRNDVAAAALPHKVFTRRPTTKQPTKQQKRKVNT